METDSSQEQQQQEKDINEANKPTNNRTIQAKDSSFHEKKRSHMSTDGMEGVCDEFNDSDDLEDNEEDLEAFGSIFSWDEAEAEEKNETIKDVAANPPADHVVFTTQDGVPQFNFLAHTGSDVPKAPTKTEAPSVSVPLPLPTPISGMRTNLLQSAQEQAAPVALPVASQNPIQPAANAFPLFAQSPDMQNAAAMSFPNANLFLRQLQFAQLQQQIQAVQQVQQQQAQQQQAQPQAPQQAQPQQQQQPGVQFAAQTFPSNMVQFPVIQQQTNSAAAVRPATSMPPLAPAPKKTKTSSSTKATRVKKKPTAGMVSASDTEGEAVLSDPLAMAYSEDMTPKEKAQANRDRNREHARNTRLRKKAYLEKLKTTVDDLCQERDTLVTERAAAASLLVEVQTTRTEVLMSFFALRTSNEKRRKLWASIFDESRCTCTMPVTPYRSFPASEVQLSRCSRTIMGIDGIMTDTASLHVFFDCLVDREAHPDGKISFRYTLVTDEAVVANNQMMARWFMKTTNAREMGAKEEVTKEGMLCCKFNGAHKITSIELMFDVMAFMLQLKQASDSEGFSVVPNTVQNCQQSFGKPMVLTMADPPYSIIQVNKEWEDLTGYSSAEVVGLTSCRILQDETMTNRAKLDSLMLDVRYRRPAYCAITNKTKGGDMFANFFVVFPLSTDSRISYYVGLTMFTHPGILLEDQKRLQPPPKANENETTE